jgi:cell division transport system ATP-binding protein
LVVLQHVYKTYQGPVHALKDINLEIKKGDFVYLTGPSGAGKTTLFKLLSAYDKPSNGRVRVAGYDLDAITSKEVPYFRRKIGVVFQDFKLLKDQSVFDNVSLPLQILGQNSFLIKKKVQAALEMVGLTHRWDFYPEQISGGEKQRVAIARALIHQPELLIADEPTGNLDPDLSDEIMSLFDKINAQGTTLIVATHDHSYIYKKQKNHIKLKEGQLVV